MEVHEPIQAILLFPLVVHPILGYAVDASDGYDDIIAGRSVGRGRRHRRPAFWNARMIRLISAELRPVERQML